MSEFDLNFNLCTLQQNNKDTYIRIYCSFILDGFSLTIWPRFIKFVKLSLRQSFPIYNNRILSNYEKIKLLENNQLCNTVLLINVWACVNLRENLTIALKKFLLQSSHLCHHLPPLGCSLLLFLLLVSVFLCGVIFRCVHFIIWYCKVKQNLWAWQVVLKVFQWITKKHSW